MRGHARDRMRRPGPLRPPPRVSPRALPQAQPRPRRTAHDHMATAFHFLISKRLPGLPPLGALVLGPASPRSASTSISASDMAARAGGGRGRRAPRCACGRWWGRGAGAHMLRRAASYGERPPRGGPIAEPTPLAMRAWGPQRAVCLQTAPARRRACAAPAPASTQHARCWPPSRARDGSERPLAAERGPEERRGRGPRWAQSSRPACAPRTAPEHARRRCGSCKARAPAIDAPRSLSRLCVDEVRDAEIAIWSQ
jgi:hypothetical protein